MKMDYLSLFKPEYRPYILIASGILIFSWWVYSNSNKDRQVRETMIKSRLGNLYSPALGLLISKHSRRIDAEKFKTEFAQLLIKYRFEADYEIGTEMDKWLKGENNELLLRDLLQEICNKMHKKLYNNAIYSTLIWLVTTPFFVLYTSFLILLFSLLLYKTYKMGTFKYIAESNVIFYSLVVISPTISGILAYLYEKWKRKKRKKRIHTMQRDLNIRSSI